MGTGAVTAGGDTTGFAHLIDPNRKWYNNRRLIILNAWIVLLYVLRSSSPGDFLFLTSARLSVSLPLPLMATMGV